jgi:acyl-CoA synthetase (NDP forming)
MTETSRFSPQRLRGLFEPQSIALVGASDKSSWSMMVHNNLTLGEYTGRIYYINPRNPAVHGRPTVPRLAGIGEPVDLAYIMVPGEAVLPVVREMAEAGIHNAIVLTAGFAEQDEEGRLRQQELQRLALDHDIAMLGPNCLGFVNLTRHIEAMPNTGSHPLVVGSVALLSQSGALAANLANYAHEQPIGLSLPREQGAQARIPRTLAGIGEGMRFVWHHRLVRVLTLVSFGLSFTGGAVNGVVATFMALGWDTASPGIPPHLAR